jgi:predicted TIM-barrel fold metal-dependent hydrolase
MLDPTQSNAVDVLRQGVQRHGLKGVTLFPAMHHFHAYDERLYSLSGSSRAGDPSLYAFWRLESQHPR